MIPELGHYALTIAMSLALAQALAGLGGAAARQARPMDAATTFALGHALSLGVAFAALAWAYAVTDLTVVNVIENSHSLKPLLYKLTGTWGNHEGSLLLWGLVLGICSAAVAGFGRSLPTTLRANVLGVLGLVSAGFLAFMVLTSNPFTRTWPPPADGQDLNPLLQDPGLAFHPPMLYLGYVGFAVAFAFACAALIEGRVDAAFGRWVRPWTLAAWCFLTLGIALGSWWAYYELGWGGYWFWDPVENSSLLPWLTGTALVHSAIVVEKREQLRTWTVLLAIATFACSLLGTFLVRSGILNSVHAFASDPARGVFILALLGVTIGGALLLFALRAPLLAPARGFATVSREGALVLNNILLCAIAFVVAVGTLFPLFADLIAGAKFSVGPPFFNATVLPVAAPLLVAMAFGPLLPWKRGALEEAARRLWPAALAAGAGVLVSMAAFGAPVLPALGLAAGAWLVAGAVIDLAGRARWSFARVAGIPRAAWGAAIAHAGMGVLAAGVAGMAMASERVLLVQPGEAVEHGGYVWRLEAVADRTGPNWAAREATITVTSGDRVITTLVPQRRFYPVQRTTTTEASISTNGMRDLYAVLGEERQGGAVLRLHVNPLAPWIWLGAMIMALGGALSLADRRLRVGAPVRRPLPAAVPAE